MFNNKLRFMRRIRMDKEKIGLKGLKKVKLEKKKKFTCI